MEGIVRLLYDEDSNWLSSHRKRMHDKTKQFIFEKSPAAIKRVLEHVEGVESEQGVHLFYCFWDSLVLSRHFGTSNNHGLVVLAFPRYEEITRYYIKPTCVSSPPESDPIKLHSFTETIYLDDSCRAMHVSVPLGRNDEQILNKIVGAILLKSNPYASPRKYPWFVRKKN